MSNTFLPRKDLFQTGLRQNVSGGGLRFLHPPIMALSYSVVKQSEYFLVAILRSAPNRRLKHDKAFQGGDFL